MSKFMVNIDGSWSLEGQNEDEYGNKIVFDILEKDEWYSGSIYSDRMLQQDYPKHNQLCMKHFGDEGQYWSQRDPKKIEEFLIDFIGKPLRLVKVVTGDNVSNGYPWWCFMYQYI
jgi:hypothetical protein